MNTANEREPEARDPLDPWTARLMFAGAAAMLALMLTIGQIDPRAMDDEPLLQNSLLSAGIAMPGLLLGGYVLGHSHFVALSGWCNHLISFLLLAIGLLGITALSLFLGWLNAACGWTFCIATCGGVLAVAIINPRLRAATG